MRLDAGILPEDWPNGAFAARLDTPEGPCAVALLDGEAFDMTPAFGTTSRWLNEADPVRAVRARGVPMALDLPGEALPRLLAPVDLHAVKACGVTYVRSMLERVIEERCRGDASRAESVRAEVRGIIGEDLAAVQPGSAKAARLKAASASPPATAERWRRSWPARCGRCASCATSSRAPTSALRCW